MPPSTPDATALGAPAGWRLVAAGQASEAGWRVRPVVFLQLVIWLLVIANLGRIPLLSTGDREAPLMFNDIFVMALLAVGAVTALTERSFRVDRVGGIALGFAAIGAFSAVLAIPRFGLSGFQLVISLAYLARWMVYFGLYLVLVNVTRASDVTSVWRTLERMILVFAAFGLFQAVFIPHFAQVLYPESRVVTDFDEQGHRLVSTVLEPNIAGAMIMLVLLVQFAQLAAGEKISSWKPLLLAAALVATLSRSSVLGMIVGTMLIVAVRGVSKKMVRAAIVSAVLVLAALPKMLAFARSYNKLGVDASALSRLASWLKAYTVFRDHPVFGVGFNTFAFVQERYGFTRLGNGTYSTDGGLLFIAVMTGIVGLALYVWMLAVIVRRCRTIWRNAAAPTAWRALATGIAAGTIAIVVHSLFVNSILTTFVMEPLWVLWGLSFVMARALARPADDDPSPRLVGVRSAA